MPEPEPAPPVQEEQQLPPVLPRSTTAPAKLTVATRLPQPPNILLMEYAKLGIGGLLACVLLCGWRACRRCRSRRRQSGEITITKRAPSPVVQARGTRARKLSKADDDDWDDLEGGWGPAPAPAPRAATPPARKAVRPARQPARQPARSARPQLGGGATPARSAAAAPPSRPATTATPPPRPSVTRAFFLRPFFFSVRRPDRAARRRRRWRPGWPASYAETSPARLHHHRERTERFGRSEVPSTGPPRHRHKQRNKTQAPARAGPRPRGPRRGGLLRRKHRHQSPRRRRGRPPSTRATPGTRTTTSTTFWATAGTTTRRRQRASRRRRGRCRL